MHELAEPHPLIADIAPLPGATAIWLGAYQQMVAGNSRREILDEVCRQLALQLALPLVSLCRRVASGQVTMEGHSHERALWIELQRMPERWDGTVAGDGPAARALRDGHAAWMVIGDEGFLPWRRAAEAEQVAAAGAWPLTAAGDTWLLQLYATNAAWFADGARLAQLEALCADLAALLDDEARLRQQRLLATALSQAGNPCFITDLDGSIVWSNPAFTRMTGHSAEAVLGQNPRILQSGRMGQRYYQGLWNTLRAGQVWSGETIDRDRLGVNYTIRQTISPFASGERISHYLSVHDDISRQKAVQRRAELDQPLDPQTGLLNPASFEQALHEACEQAQPFLLAMVSLPKLQAVATAMGPEAQAMVAAEMGDRVRTTLGAPHQACRSAEGDLLLLLRADPPSDNPALLARLRPVLTEAYPLIGEQLTSDYRAVALSGPEPGDRAEALLRRLDQRMSEEPPVRAPVGLGLG